MFPFRSPSGSTPRAASRSGSDPSAGDLGARLSRLRARRRQRGVALVMVLGTLTLLTVMLTEFQDEASAELGGWVRLGVRRGRARACGLGVGAPPPGGGVAGGAARGGGGGGRRGEGRGTPPGWRARPGGRPPPPRLERPQ